MKELLAVNKLEIESSQTNTVSARDLHSFLGVGKDFSNWIKKQIERARLLENRDFIKLAQKGVGGKFDSIEYHLTLEAGKHIAMLSGTEKGFEVREYFIECEKAAQQPQFNLPNNFREALLQLVDQVEKTEALQLTITENAPKVELANAISSSSKSIMIGDYAKVISSQIGFIVGRNNFFEWLRFSRIANNSNSPYQRYIDCGWFEIKESTYENENTNGPRVCFTTMITGQGQLSILEKFKKSEHFQKFLNKKANANRKNLSKQLPLQ